MSANTDKLLLDVINELQLLRGQLHAIKERMDEAKIEVILTAKARPKKRRRRRNGTPKEMPY